LPRAVNALPHLFIFSPNLFRPALGYLSGLGCGLGLLLMWPSLDGTNRSAAR